MKKAHRDHFKEFEEHTLLKHAILRRYIQAWGRKLLFVRGRGFDRIWIVDAFAGTGSDEQGNPGSPLIAAGIAQEVERDLVSRGISGKTSMEARLCRPRYKLKGVLARVRQ